jgi:hypothetical protein
MAEKSKGLGGIPAPVGEVALLCPDWTSPEDVSEKSKGSAGIPAPGGEAALLCPDWTSPEDVSDLAFLFSVEPAFLSKEHKI